MCGMSVLPGGDQAFGAMEYAGGSPNKPLADAVGAAGLGMVWRKGQGLCRPSAGATFFFFLLLLLQLGLQLGPVLNSWQTGVAPAAVAKHCHALKSAAGATQCWLRHGM